MSVYLFDDFSSAKNTVYAPHVYMVPANPTHNLLKQDEVAHNVHINVQKKML